MSYRTTFRGVLKFRVLPTADVLMDLSLYLQKDARRIEDVPTNYHKNGRFGNHWRHIDLMLTRKFDGLVWDEDAESTGELEHILNFLVHRMRDIHGHSTFFFDGIFFAQGEDPDDRYKIVAEDGVSRREELFVTCSCCGNKISFNQIAKELRSLKEAYGVEDDWKAPGED